MLVSGCWLFVIRDWLLLVDCCMMYVVWCLLSARVLLVVDCLLFVVCLWIVCIFLNMFCAVCCLLVVVC